MKKKLIPPSFSLQQEVEFETAPDGNSPRWCLNRDMGYSDKWAQGLITDISEYSVEVFAFFPDGHTDTVRFPNFASIDFEPGQWWYPGYLRPMHDSMPECDCGCEGLGYHWNFCTLKKWEETKDAI